MYKQITYTERCIIGRLRSRRFSIRRIAEVLGRAPSSISRELRRNRPNGFHYRVWRAQECTNARRRNSRKKSHYKAKDWRIIEYLLKEYWSPEQISLVLRLKKILWISHQTIYTYIHKDRKKGGLLWKFLRQSKKKRRKGYGRADSRGVLGGKRSLDKRPPGAHNRSRIGHFEVDLVHGSSSSECILTLVDRKSRLTIIKKVLNKSKKLISRVLVKIIREFDIKTITADNGTEWHGYKKVEKATDVKFYFTEPYHSWERGTNENANGLIRQFIPKKKSMKYISQWECNWIAKKLNRRPRKILNLETPMYSHFGLPLMLHFKV